jgi:hypothetical protein
MEDIHFIKVALKRKENKISESDGHVIADNMLRLQFAISDNDHLYE